MLLLLLHSLFILFRKIDVTKWMFAKVLKHEMREVRQDTLCERQEWSNKSSPTIDHVTVCQPSRFIMSLKSEWKFPLLSHSSQKGWKGWKSTPESSFPRRKLLFLSPAQVFLTSFHVAFFYFLILKSTKEWKWSIRKSTDLVCIEADESRIHYDKLLVLSSTKVHTEVCNRLESLLHEKLYSQESQHSLFRDQLQVQDKEPYMREEDETIDQYLDRLLCYFQQKSFHRSNESEWQPQVSFFFPLRIHWLNYPGVDSQFLDI